MHVGLMRCGTRRGFQPPRVAPLWPATSDLSDPRAPFLLSVARVLLASLSSMVFLRKCIGSSSNCYSPMFLFFLTSDQDNMVVIVSYSWTISTKCSAPLSTTVFSHRFIICFSLVGLGWSRTFDLTIFFYYFYFYFRVTFCLFWEDC